MTSITIKKNKHFKKTTYELIYKIEIEFKCRRQLMVTRV